MIDIFTRVHGGVAPEVKGYAEEDKQALRSKMPTGFVSAALKDAWTAENWAFSDDFKSAGWNGPSLEQIAAEFKST